MNATELHPLLARDGIPVGSLAACTVLLMNDSQYPWLILVPERPGLRDWDELSHEDAMLVHGDIKRACQVLRALFRPCKLNVASLGNMVPQLHIHVIARHEADRAWPKPVWGLYPPLPYSQDALAERLARIKAMITAR